jgi:dCTP deaminase
VILKTDYITDLLEAPDEKDPLIISPRPDTNELRKSGSASLNLRLGCWFVTLQRTRASLLAVTDPTKPSASESRLTKKHYVPFGKEFVLHPGGFVLGVTLEWIRLTRTLAGYVIGRSSWGRRGLIIATATGVHPGFSGCLTLELSNVGEIPIEIRPGAEICQLFLHEVHSTSKLADRSGFIGRRQPILGTIRMDSVAKKLAEADQS